MKKIILATIFVFFSFASLSVAQTESDANSIKVPILIYHSIRPYYPGITDLVKEYTVPPDIFDNQLKYLKNNGFTPININDLVDYFNSGKILPPKPFIITFDDGWKSQFRYAFPILQKYNNPATFYIYSNVIGDKAFVSWDDVKALISSNMVIGDHTKSHPMLSKITDDNVLIQEISDSKKIIEDKIGKTINDFAYPFGDYNDHDVNEVMQSGYRSARTVNKGVNENKNILFKLNGIIITGDFNRFVSLINE